MPEQNLLTDADLARFRQVGDQEALGVDALVILRLTLPGGAAWYVTECYEVQAGTGEYLPLGTLPAEEVADYAVYAWEEPGEGAFGYTQVLDLEDAGVTRDPHWMERLLRGALGEI